MREDLRERRQQTYHMLYRLGVSYGNTVSRIAEEYDVAESTVKSDIANMSNWVRELDVSLHDGLLRVRKVRDQHQELEQLALEARQNGDLAEARRAREAIVKALETENRMAQRLGLTNEEPQRHEVEIGETLSEEDQEMLNDICGIEGDTVDLEEAR
jgi:hypothetical protein